MSALRAAIAGAARRHWQVALALALTAAVPADTLWLAPVSQGAAQAVLVALVAASAVAGWGRIPGWLRPLGRRKREQARHRVWVEAMRATAQEQAGELPAWHLNPERWDYLRERGHRP